MDDFEPIYTETMPPDDAPESVSTHVAIGRGTAIGRYLVESELGAGGVGVVLKARDPGLNRRVAIKLMRVGYDDDAANAMLMREAQAIAQLNHPNVVTIHDVGEHDGEVFIAMELVDGISLKDWMAEKHDWREVLSVFLQAGRGLAAAHELGLVHRDFKPSNAIIGRDGRLRVLDFGLARVFDTHHQPADTLGIAANLVLAQTLSRVGGLVGTPAYMSPEQFLAEVPDARSDVFSFCVSLYEALYGRRPFAGDDIVTLRGNVLSGNVEPPSPRANVPAWLLAIVKRGLATDAAKRFASMAELLAALEAGPGRSRGPGLLVVGGAVAVIAGVAVAFALASSSSRPVAAADRSSDAEPTDGAVSDGPTIIVRVPPSNARVDAGADDPPPPPRPLADAGMRPKRVGPAVSVRKEPRPKPRVQPDASAEELSKRGKARFLAGDYRVAEELFARAVAIRPDQRYLWNLCYAQHKQGKRAQVQSSCGKVARGPNGRIAAKASALLRAIAAARKTAAKPVSASAAVYAELKKLARISAFERAVVVCSKAFTSGNPLDLNVKISCVGYACMTKNVAAARRFISRMTAAVLPAVRQSCAAHGVQL